MKNLRIIVRRAAQAYNDKRSPEANLEVIEVDEDDSTVVTRITGSFCRTCGVDDWIVDFQYELKGLGVEAKIEDYVIDYDREEAIAKFKVLSLSEKET